MIKAFIKKILPDKYSCRCKVCNYMVAFDRSKSVQKVWLCPICGHRNYSKPKPQNG